MPIITFINKLDREGRDPFDLLDEIEQDLQLDVTPASWPIGMGRDFLGCYDLLHDQLILMDQGPRQVVTEGEMCEGLDDPKLDALLPERRRHQPARGGRDGARPVPAVRSSRPTARGT